jgi:uncharacterized protein (DUF2147 family)
MRFTVVLPVMLLLVVSGSAFGQTARSEADAVLGEWLTEEGKARVEIYRCGDAYCGKIVWLKEPIKNGKVVVDEKNPDPRLRETPVLGMVLMHDFRYDGDGEYDGGSIYDAENGETYSAQMTLVDNGVLNLRGYVLVPLFGRTTKWVRQTGDGRDQPPGDQKR